jgi:hypothetical protein
VQSIDEPMHFVEFPPQVSSPSPRHARCTALEGFHHLRDVLDVPVQRLQQLLRLCGVGVIGHAVIFTSTAMVRAPRVDRGRWLAIVIPLLSHSAGCTCTNPRQPAIRMCSHSHNLTYLTDPLQARISNGFSRPSRPDARYPAQRETPVLHCRLARTHYRPVSRWLKVRIEVLADVAGWRSVFDGYVEHRRGRRRNCATAGARTQLQPSWPRR